MCCCFSVTKLGRLRGGGRWGVCVCGFLWAGFFFSFFPSICEYAFHLFWSLIFCFALKDHFCIKVRGKKKESQLQNCRYILLLVKSIGHYNCYQKYGNKAVIMIDWILLFWKEMVNTMQLKLFLGTWVLKCFVALVRPSCWGHWEFC